MAKIKNWEKIADGQYRVVWRNTRWMKTHDKWATIEEIIISESAMMGWVMVYTGYGGGQVKGFQTNNIARSKTEAVKYATAYMKAHPNG